MEAICRVGLAATIAALGLASAARAGEHVVTPAAAQTALDEAVAGRSGDLERLDAILASPSAERAAARGLDVAGARRALASLSDEELSDLAARVRDLRSDPVAGLRHDVEDMLVIFLIVALVILVLKAA